MDDWDEIKRLAADFQRTQTSDTLQKISERNCIDIVKKLTDLSFIELIYTCDGKEFLTPEHLLKEIEDEIYYNEGRVHLHDLASNLNVDYQHVENKAKELARSKPDEYSLVLGQVIHSAYKKTLGKQIYDTMITMGQLSIADFAKSLDLPSEFLLSLVKEILPQVFKDHVASPDERTYYTTDMMDRYHSIISGTLSAITKPTTIASIMKKIDIPEKMFNPIVDSLIKSGRVDAAIENRLYIPSIYAREQNEWIDKFYKTNSYIDYDVLLRKDIKQPKAFLRKRFPEGVALKNCFVSTDLISQVESMIEDCIASNSLIDISTIVPASIQPSDIEIMLSDLLKKNKLFSSSCLILQQTNLCSLGYIATCKQSLSAMMADKARDDLKQGKLMNHFLGGKPAKTSRSRQQSEKSQDDTNKNDQLQDKETDGKSKNFDVVEVEKSSDVVGSPVNPALKQEEDKFELTAEDLKRERRQKKGKQRLDDSTMTIQDSDEDNTGKKSKGKINRKGGCGVQGREIRLKATKKKYVASASKQPKSAKKSAPTDVEPTKATKEQLEFMSTDELIEHLRNKSRDAGVFSDEMLESIAVMMVEELNQQYEALSRRILDDHLRSCTGDGSGRKSSGDGEVQDEDIDLIE